MSRDDLPFDPDLLDDEVLTPSRRDLAIEAIARHSWTDWWRRRRVLLGLIGLGGGLGSLARYGVERAVSPSAAGFPWATFLVNLVGCLLVGALMVVFVEVRPKARYGRPFLVIGVIGGLTTYSTLMSEIRSLAASSSWGVLASYLVTSVVFGVLCVVLGVAAARLLAGLPLLGPQVVRSATQAEDPS